MARLDTETSEWAAALSLYRRRYGPTRHHPRCTFGIPQSAKRAAYRDEVAIANALPHGWGPVAPPSVDVVDPIKAPRPMRPTLTRAQARKLRKRGKSERARVSAAPQGSSPVDGTSRGKRSAGDYLTARRDANWRTRDAVRKETNQNNNPKS